MSGMVSHRAPAAAEPETALEVRDIAPTNAMLDLLESQVRALTDLGCEPQIRARLARLLPPPAPVPAVVDAMTAAALLTALRAARSNRMTEAELAANRAARQLVLGWMRSAREITP